MVEVEQAGAKDLPATEGQQLPRYAGGTISGKAHLADLFVERMIRRQPFVEEICLDPDHREQIVEVMSDAARELTQRFHALGAAELLLQLPG